MSQAGSRGDLPFEVMRLAKVADRGCHDEKRAAVAEEAAELRGVARREDVEGSPCSARRLASSIAASSVRGMSAGIFIHHVIGSV